jgi:glycine dehydrogenase
MPPPARTFFVDAACHPQTIDIVKTRAKPLGDRCHRGRLAQLQGRIRLFRVLGAIS